MNTTDLNILTQEERDSIELGKWMNEEAAKGKLIMVYSPTALQGLWEILTTTQTHINKLVEKGLLKNKSQANN